MLANRTTSVVFTPPTHPDPTKWPFYNGRVVITSSTGEELAVPYMGMHTPPLSPLPS